MWLLHLPHLRNPDRFKGQFKGNQPHVAPKLEKHPYAKRGNSIFILRGSHTKSRMAVSALFSLRCGHTPRAMELCSCWFSEVSGSARNQPAGSGWSNRPESENQVFQNEITAGLVRGADIGKGCKGPFWLPFKTTPRRVPSKRTYGEMPIRL